MEILKILKKNFFDCTIDLDDLCIYNRSSKTVYIKKADSARTRVINELLRILSLSDEEEKVRLIKERKPNIISDVLSKHIVISETLNVAINTLKWLAPTRDESLFEIDRVEVDGKVYHLVWD